MADMYNKMRSQPRNELILDAIDLFMIILVIVNLVWIVFDSLFAADVVQNMLKRNSPNFYHFYREQVHQHFLYYDLFFVAIYIVEILVRWVISIRQHVYQKWYFYPFAHWYDVLGCIPIGSLRALRLLRVVSLLMRLQKRGVIDLTDTSGYRFLNKYFDVLIEEISDRVIIRILDAIEEEIRYGSPVAHRILTDVVEPRREPLAKWISVRLSAASQTVYFGHKKAIARYVEQLVARVLEENQEVATIERIPGLGKIVTSSLKSAIKDVVLQVIERVSWDLAASRNQKVANEMLTVIFDSLLEETDSIATVTREITIESIGLIKRQVRIKRWRDRI
nr:hypothetical protein [Gammaproteobacteria bacterium]